MNGVLFAPFDYRDADELVLVEEQSAGREPGMTGYPTYADLRNENLTIQSMSALTGGRRPSPATAGTPSASRRTGHMGVLPNRGPHSGDWPRLRAGRG